MSPTGGNDTFSGGTGVVHFDCAGVTESPTRLINNNADTLTALTTSNFIV